MTSSRRPLSHILAPCLALGFLLITAGCRIDILRIRAGTPLKKDEFEKLEVKKTTRSEALDALGAPEKVEWKNGDDYFWYLYADTVDTGIRFQFPPFRSVFGYQHNFLRLDENADEVNAIQLVFDQHGVLKQKSLRLSEAYRAPPEHPSGWKIHLMPNVEYSAILGGDAGIKAYDRLFKDGYRAGLDVAFQPLPVFSLIASGSYQEHQGDHFPSPGKFPGIPAVPVPGVPGIPAVAKGDRLSFDDLKLYQLEIGIRLSAPISILSSFTDFEEVKKVLFEEDLNKLKGFRIYVQATTGGAINSRVPVKSKEIPIGNYFDRRFRFSTNIGMGIEYVGRYGSIYSGLAYQSIEAFDQGNTTLHDNAEGFATVLLVAGASVSF